MAVDVGLLVQDILRALPQSKQVLVAQRIRAPSSGGGCRRFESCQGRMSEKSSSRTYGTCKVCNKRKARYVNMTCDACRALVEAEGSHDIVGVAKESPARQRWRQEAAEYNKLIKQRMTQQQIAELWNIPVTKLRSMVWRWKSQGGIAIVPGLAGSLGPLKPATKKVQKRNDHGTGKWGVAGCWCAEQPVKSKGKNICHGAVNCSSRK